MANGIKSVHLMSIFVFLAESNIARISADVVLGGLFPVHKSGNSDEKPCGTMLFDKGIQRLEAMQYAINQINSNFSYWKFRLEATYLDTCSSETHALEQSLQFLQHSCANKSGKVTAVVGAANSGVSASVANIFRLFKLPQVSYASTSQELDDMYKYPNFFRVVPSDKFQVNVILDILLEFRWTFVSMVVSKGEYGERAEKSFREMIPDDEICIATVQVLPRDAKEENYTTVIHRLDDHAKAKVVIVFLNEDKISPLLEACERSGLPKDRFVWLGSDGWGAKERIVKRGTKKIAEGAITILPKRFSVKAGFDDYFRSLEPRTNKHNPWFREFWESKFNCTLGISTWNGKRSCTGGEDLGASYQQEGLVPMVIDSVLLLATAIRSLCKDNPEMCDDPEHMDRNLLLSTIANTRLESIQGHDMIISFDKARNIPINYTIFQYRRVSDRGYAYKPIGEWNPYERLRLSEEPEWRDTEEEESYHRPLSTCSQECKVGEERIRNTEFSGLCCRICRPCGNNFYLPAPNKPCTECPIGKIPSDDKTYCVELKAGYLGENIGSPWALVPLIFSVLGLVCTSGVFIVFLLHHQTPIIMASGRELCYVILVGIVLCYCFPFIVLLKPSEISCGVLRVGMGLGLSVCYSAIFTKTNRLSRIFEVSMKSMKRPSYISPESQIIICVCLILIQITLTVLWLIIQPPDVEVKYMTLHRKWMMLCSVDGVLDGISVILGLLYNMLLLILCTIYAYKTRNIPENFNETKWISFTMYSSCIVWLAFIPIYCGAKENFHVQSTILSMSVSFSGTVTLVCIFLPKIYIVLFHPERNVRYPSSSGNSGTGTLDSGQPVRFLRTVDYDPGLRQPSPINRPDVSFTFQKPENNYLT